MQSLRALLAVAGLGFTMAVQAASPVNLGTVATFAAFTDTDARTAYQAYDRSFTFTLATDATVRIDMREIGNTHWLSNYAAGLTDVSLTLLNGSNQLIGTAAVDAAFNGSKTECLSGGKCRTAFALGHTLTTLLTAGTYTMGLTGRSLGSGPESVLNLGVLVLGAGDAGSYFSAITPATNLPEPGAWAMMGLGLLGIGVVARRAGRQQA